MTSPRVDDVVIGRATGTRYVIVAGPAMGPMEDNDEYDLQNLETTEMLVATRDELRCFVPAFARCSRRDAW